MQLRLRFFLAALAFLFAAACADALTGPHGRKPDGSSQAHSTAPVPGNAIGLTQYPCTFGIKDQNSGEFRTRHARVGFPVSELHPDGALRDYVYRAYAGGEVVIVARCVIPATQKAGERVDRLFKLQSRHDHDAGSQNRHDHDADGITTLSDDCCEPITVIACQYGGTYPDCEPAPSDPDYDFDWCHDFGGCGGSGDWKWSDGGGRTGGGSGTPTCDPSAGCDPDTVCDPQTDPDCEQPLTATDTATINNALRQVLRHQFSDTTAARVCGEMVTWFNTAMARGYVFRGLYDSNATTDGDPEHYGNYYNGHIHFDPAGLNAANAGNSDAIREVAITALHEAGHYAGYRHPAGATFDGQGRDFYTDHPFDRLNPGPNSCVPR